MILDTDQQIQDSVLNNVPVTVETLRELGWKYVSSTLQRCGYEYLYWTIWKYNNYYIEMFDDGRCFFKGYQNATRIRIDTVGELKQRIQFRQKEERLVSLPF